MAPKLEMQNNISYFSQDNCMSHEKNFSSMSATKVWTDSWMFFKGVWAPGGVDRAGGLQEGEGEGGDDEGEQVCPHNSLIVATSS